MNNAELWQAALGEIELSISKANFSTWFKNTTILSNESGKVVIGVPNGFAKEWLENKYNTYIFRALRNFRDDIREISCVIYAADQVSQNDAKKSETVSIHAHQQSSQPYQQMPTSHRESMQAEGFTPRPLQSMQQDQQASHENNINPRYTFENFIIGENNELARAACYAVSQNLGKIYNPLFIYGGVGLGKTHLLLNSMLTKHFVPYQIS